MGLLGRISEVIVPLFTKKFSWTGYEKPTPHAALMLMRQVFTDKSTTGALSLDGQFQCYILEPTCRQQPGVKLAIPTGIFEVTLYKSPRFGMEVPLLNGIPGHTYVEMHPGNFEGAENGLGVEEFDSKDCLLPGQTCAENYVGESRVAFNALMPKIREKLAQGKLYISVTGGGRSA